MKQIDHRTLGKLGIIGAPFLLVEFICQLTISNATLLAVLTGFFGLVYMLGWMMSLLGLLQSKAAGNSIFSRAVVIIQLALLTVANIFNVMQTIFPTSNPLNYQALDIFWPVSNLFMFITSVTISVAGNLSGFKKYIPLLAGTWFPLSCYPFMIMGRTAPLLIYSGIYALVAYAMLGNLVTKTTPVSGDRDASFLLQ